MAKTFLDDFDTFVRIGIDCVGLSVNQGTKLNDELLEPIKVELLGLSLFD